jgi:hypothetical protein
MDFVKQYIIQCISAAANTLRLSTEKMEVVALLREAITNSANIGQDIIQMKKITVLSTFAIRLNEIYNYLTTNQLDLLRLSDKFREHSQYLIKDLSAMLDMLNLQTFKAALERISESKTSLPKNRGGFSTDILREKLPGKTIEISSFKTEKSETDIEKEKIIFEEDKEEEDSFFQNYETEILKPIKPIDKLLKFLSTGEQASPDDLNKFAEQMKNNGEFSSKVGFDIIANMHHVLAKALLLIKVRELMPGHDVIEAMRACLIVIVAVVKGKEVDITNYLNRAEEFGREIQSLKIKGLD